MSLVRVIVDFLIYFKLFNYHLQNFMGVCEVVCFWSSQRGRGELYSLAQEQTDHLGPLALSLLGFILDVLLISVRFQLGN